MTQRILHYREQFALVARLRQHQPIGHQPGLFEPGRVKVEARQGPEHGSAGQRSRRDARKKQGRGRVLRQRRRGCRHLVQAARGQTAIGEPTVNLLDSERNRPAAARGRVEGRDAPAQIGDRVEASNFH